jgi:hypothetical protein
MRWLSTGRLASISVDVKILDGIVFNPVLTNLVSGLALSIARAHSRAAPLRHVLLYGPPGTGKTMVARRIATLSGLDYAIMSGGDLGPLGQSAVSELHLLLQWAKSSPKGLLLFIDEADAALSDRTKHQVSEVAQNVLNTILYHTGGQSKVFMLVLATNRPEDLDEALLDRMDEVIQVPLPGLVERKGLCKLYFEKTLAPLQTHTSEDRDMTKSNIIVKFLYYFTKYVILKPIIFLFMMIPNIIIFIKLLIFPLPPKPKGIDKTFTNLDSKLSKLAEQTQGFSGREIHKLFLSIQGAVFSSDDCMLNNEIWNNVIEWKLGEFARKQALQLLGESSPMLSPTSGLQRSSKVSSSPTSTSRQKPQERNGNRRTPSPTLSSDKIFSEFDNKINNELNNKSEKTPSKQKKKKQGKQQNNTPQLSTALLSPQQKETLQQEQNDGSKAKIVNSKKTSDGELFQVRFEVAGETEEVWCSREELTTNYLDAIKEFEKNKN